MYDKNDTAPADSISRQRHFPDILVANKSPAYTAAAAGLRLPA